MNKSIRGVYRATQYLFLVLVTLLTIACSSKVQPEKAEKLTVEIATAADINPNDKGVANPLRIALYTLKSTDEFQSSDFFTITEENTPSLKEQMDTCLTGLCCQARPKK